MAACAAVVLAGCGTRPPDVPPAMVDVVDALREGGYVVFLRHAAADVAIPSGGDVPGDDCGRQRNLTAAGRQDAAALGVALDALDITFQDVRASPYCRTMDTARDAFGEVQADERLAPDPDSALRIEPLLAAPPEGENRLLVGHASTSADLLGIDLEEGEAAVLAPGGDGEPRVLGRFSAAALAGEAD